MYNFIFCRFHNFIHYQVRILRALFLLFINRIFLLEIPFTFKLLPTGGLVVQKVKVPCL